MKPEFKHATWNHRVMKEIDRNGDAYYYICEVHYTDNVLRAYSPPTEVMGDDIKSLRWTLKMMNRALKKPVLTPKRFERKKRAKKIST